jgi:hypothetical protein
LFTDLDELFTRVAEFGEVPAPLTHGTPFINQPKGEQDVLRV